MGTTRVFQRGLYAIETRGGDAPAYVVRYFDEGKQDIETLMEIPQTIMIELACEILQCRFEEGIQALSNEQLIASWLNREA